MFAILSASSQHITPHCSIFRIMTAIFCVSKFSDFYHITGIWNNLEQKYLSRQYSTNVFEPAHEIIVLITQATSEGSAAQ